MNKIFKVSDDDLDEKSNAKIELIIEPIFTESENIVREPFKKPISNKILNNESYINTLIAISFDVAKVIEERKIDKKRATFRLTLKDLVMTTICPCFATEKLKKKEKIYNEMMNYTIEYTDIINYALLRSEFERLLYVIFTKEQLALFNLISVPQNPEKKGELSSITRGYQYTKSIKDQEFVISNIKFFQNDLDKKLVSLLQ